MTQDQIDALRHRPIAPQQLFINGGWQAAADGATLDVISPIDGQPLTTLAAAGVHDVDRAVAAASAVFERGTWSRLAPAERKKVMHRIADRIEAQQAELAVLGVRDNGTEISMAWKAEPGSAAATFRFYAECVDKINGEIAPAPDGTLGLVHKAPVGVVAAVVPWNFPLMIGAWKIAPALAAGNSVVLKPSEDASLSLLRLAQLCAQAGLPEGVLNVVTGTGALAGDALARHMDVDLITFTGSGPAGRRLMLASAESNLKRVYLELGGKSPNIVFADAPDLAQAARVSAMGIFRNSGQVCVAGSRLLVQRSVHDEFLDAVLKVALSLRVGDPLDLSTDIGAVSSAHQLAKNLQAVTAAQQEGARLRAGGLALTPAAAGCKSGFYMAPTVFDQVSPAMHLGACRAWDRARVDPVNGLSLGACRAWGRARVDPENGLSLGAKRSHTVGYGEHLQRRISPFSGSTRRAGEIFGAWRRCRLVVWLGHTPRRRLARHRNSPRREPDPKPDRLLATRRAGAHACRPSPVRAARRRCPAIHPPGAWTAVGRLLNCGSLHESGHNAEGARHAQIQADRVGGGGGGCGGGRRGLDAAARAVCGVLGGQRASGQNTRRDGVGAAGVPRQ